MDKYTIAEQSYENGYAKGYQDGKKEAIVFYYRHKLNCEICTNYYNSAPPFHRCEKCEQEALQKVEVIKMGVGLFRHKAVVRFDGSGKITTVKIRDLVGVRDNESI